MTWSTAAYNVSQDNGLVECELEQWIAQLKLSWWDSPMIWCTLDRIFRITVKTVWDIGKNVRDIWRWNLSEIYCMEDLRDFAKT